MSELHGGNLISPQSLRGGSLAPPSGLSGGTVIVADWSFDQYTGLQTITPSSTEQILETDRKVVLGNIIVNPIPQNYGLITWNGSTITVS
jgi:hypothetical protein